MLLLFLESDEEIKSQLDNLRNNIPTHVSAELIQEWTETHSYRMKELKETKGTLWDYFKSYKALPAPNIGPSLVSLTMLYAYNTTPELDNCVENWTVKLPLSFF